MNEKDLRRRQRNNQAVARCIPLLLIGAVGYGSYVFVGPLCGRAVLERDRDLHRTNIVQSTTSLTRRPMPASLSALGLESPFPSSTSASFSPWPYRTSACYTSLPSTRV